MSHEAQHPTSHPRQRKPEWQPRQIPSTGSTSRSSLDRITVRNSLGTGLGVRVMQPPARPWQRSLSQPCDWLFMSAPQALMPYVSSGFSELSRSEYLRGTLRSGTLLTSGLGVHLGGKADARRQRDQRAAVIRALMDQPATQLFFQFSVSQNSIFFRTW